MKNRTLLVMLLAAGLMAGVSCIYPVRDRDDVYPSHDHHHGAGSTGAVYAAPVSAYSSYRYGHYGHGRWPARYSGYGHYGYGYHGGGGCGW